MARKRQPGVRLERLPDPLERFRLHLGLSDYDARGETFHSLNVTGWGTFDGRPIRRAAVSWGNDVIVTADGYADPGAMAVVRQRNPDDFGFLGDDTAFFFTMRIPRFRLPRQGALTVHVDCKAGAGTWLWVPAANLVGDLAPELPAFSLGPAPVLVVGLGRSGTTLLMNCLANHPEIIALGQHPFELRQATWLWKALDILAAPADHTGSLHPDGFANTTSAVIGQNPYATRPFQKIGGAASLAQWQTRDFPLAMAEFTRNQLGGVMTAYAQEVGKPSARYFAEKVLPSSLIHTVRNLDPRTRMIFILRDPRDIAASALVFDNWKDAAPGGADNVSAEAVAGLAAQVEMLLDYDECYKSTACVVNYKTLILQPEKALGRIFRYLKVDSDAEVVSAIIAEAYPAAALSGHVTSVSSAKSIGRWVSGLPASAAAQLKPLAERVVNRSRRAA